GARDRVRSAEARGAVRRAPRRHQRRGGPPHPRGRQPPERARREDHARRRGASGGAGGRRRRRRDAAAMSILVGTGTKLVVAGLTGREGSFHGLNNRRYGTDLVAGVTPGKAGQDVEGVPSYNTFHAGGSETGPNPSM